MLVKNGLVNGCSSEEKGKISINKIKVQFINGLLKFKNVNFLCFYIKKVILYKWCKIIIGM